MNPMKFGVAELIFCRVRVTVPPDWTDVLSGTN